MAALFRRKKDPGDQPAVDPSQLSPLAGFPGQYVTGQGAGADDGQGNTTGVYDVYDQDGNLLGKDETITTAGTVTNYGYSYGTPIPVVSEPGTPSYGGFPQSGLLPSYSGFPASASSGAISAGSYGGFPGAASSSMPNENQPAGIGSSGPVGTYGGFPTGPHTPGQTNDLSSSWVTPSYGGFPGISPLNDTRQPEPVAGGFHEAGPTALPANAGHASVVAPAQTIYNDTSASVIGDGGSQPSGAYSPVNIPVKISPQEEHEFTVSQAKGQDMMASAAPVSSSLGASPPPAPTISPAAPEVPQPAQAAEIRTDSMAPAIPADKVGAVAAGNIQAFHPSSDSAAEARAHDAPSTTTSHSASLAAHPVELSPAQTVAGMGFGDEPMHGGGSAASGVAKETIKPHLTLPPTSPHDMPLGGSFSGLDPASGSHRYMGRH